MEYTKRSIQEINVDPSSVPPINDDVPSLVNDVVALAKTKLVSVTPTNSICNKGNKKRNVTFKTICKVWHYFNIIEGFDPSLRRVACKYYQQDYTCTSKTYNTGNLWTHLNNLCK